MKPITILLAFTTMVLFSCNESKTKTEEFSGTDTSKTVENKAMIPSSACYTSISGKDTFKLKLEVFPNVATGKLSYHFSEKDSNDGTFEGELRGDTLWANYTFASEGKQSIREIVFLIKDSVATEGYGEVEEKDGKMAFKNRNEITFQKGLVLHKTECGEY
ncbi:MAG: hypothetical protein ABIP35_07685 [Ginsengibacter sp.]